MPRRTRVVADRGSRFRGPLLGANEDSPIFQAPAEIGTQWYARTKQVHLPLFTNQEQEVASTTHRTWHPIGIGTPSVLLTVQSDRPSYTGFPVMRFRGAVSNSSGAQFTLGTFINNGTGGLGATLAGLPARAYDPPLIVSCVWEFSLNDVQANQNSVAAGMLSSTTAVIQTNRTVDPAGNGVFVFLPHTGTTTSTPIQAVWNSGGVTRASFSSNKAYTGLAQSVGPSALRLGVRMVLHELTAANPPLLTGKSRFEFWVEDNLITTFHAGSAATPQLPLDLCPGIALVRDTAANFVDAAFMSYSIGPVRAGSTTS